MDQKAFRDLLEAPSSSSRQTTFGRTKKREQPKKPPPPPSFKPRKVDAPVDSKYQDRATARRAGQDTEYAEVEKLKAEFEQREAALKTDKERRLLREQTQFLGGDEKHSVLVKGLDFALLAQNKAKLEGDDDLEDAFQQAGQSNDHKPPAEKEEKKQGQGFRPIGFKPIVAKEEEEKDVKWVNGKKMRKKKKKVAVEEPAAVAEDEESAAAAAAKEAVPSPAAPPADREEAAAVPPPKKKVKKATPPPPAPAPTAVKPPSEESAAPAPVPEPAQDEDDDEDVDIFADVGGWNGILSSDDDEAGPSGAEPSESAPSGKRDWFAATSLRSPSPRAPTPTTAPSPIAAPQPKPARLQGLSDSVLDSETSRLLLEQDDAPKHDAPRKRRRRGGRSKGGAAAGGDDSD